MSSVHADCSNSRKIHFDKSLRVRFIVCVGLESLLGSDSKFCLNGCFVCAFSMQSILYNMYNPQCINGNSCCCGHGKIPTCALGSSTIKSRMTSALSPLSALADRRFAPMLSRNSMHGCSVRRREIQKRTKWFSPTWAGTNMCSTPASALAWKFM